MGRVAEKLEIRGHASHYGNLRRMGMNRKFAKDHLLLSKLHYHSCNYVHQDPRSDIEGSKAAAGHLLPSHYCGRNGLLLRSRSDGSEDQQDR